MSEHRLFPYLLILGAGVLWGSTFSLTLIATSEGVHPLGLLTWQIALTVPIFFAVALHGRVRPCAWRNLRHYAVLAVVGITLPTLFYYHAAPYLSAGILSITVSSVPLFTYAIMLGLRFEPARLRRVTGILLGMIAILLLVLPDQGLESDDASWWILLVVGSALLYSVENVYIARAIDPRVDLRELLFGSNLVALLLQLPLALALGVAEPPSWLASKSGLAIVGITLTSALAYGLFFHSIRIAGPVFASQCAYVVTLAGVLWGILLFAEVHTLWVWSSVVVMLIGLVMVKPDEKRQNSEIGEAETAKSTL